MLLRQLPQGAQVHAEVHGDAARWSLTDQLLAAAVDALHVSNWQRAGKRNAPRPRPVPRPGLKPADQKRFGTARRSLAEMTEKLNRWAGR